MIDINKIEEIMKKEGNEKEFEYKGYKCFIHRMTYGNEKKLGHLNGYVKLPDNHKFTKINYSDINLILTADINYSEYYLPYCESEIGWYFGMSYDHIFDINPLTMYVMNYDHSFMMNYATYKDMIYVEDKLKRLVDELIEIGLNEERED